MNVSTSDAIVRLLTISQLMKCASKNSKFSIRVRWGWLRRRSLLRCWTSPRTIFSHTTAEPCSEISNANFMTTTRKQLNEFIHNYKVRQNINYNNTENLLKKGNDKFKVTNEFYCCELLAGSPRGSSTLIFGRPVVSWFPCLILCEQSRFLFVTMILRKRMSRGVIIT